MSGQGSGGNVLAALASFFIPRIGSTPAGPSLNGSRAFCVRRFFVDFSAWLDRSPMVHS